ncbi:hypothetical protein CA54_28490 [Symmachiella macrocystis]|uniref:Uncharacterized protein n=1 Tax=Symmachiella macrocystis TaxID=2527985 RepID=A0A5C6BQJ1_9PLAN|nr:hypothetical protein [Symmachiella macrocystis]TWU14007.1 hypothetical protein CA54_28490 [Symmachiella macrocystis]
MSGTSQFFEDWHYRLRDLQELENNPRHAGWVSKLHAKVLRYFISRYDYQPIPTQSSVTSQLSRTQNSAICSKLALRLSEENEERYRRGAECRNILAEIREANTLRTRYKT